MIESTLSYMGQLGWKSQVACVVYATPIALWGLGAIEGVVRTSFNGLSACFAGWNHQPNKAESYWNECKKDAGITKGCLLITGISLIPVVGTGWGISEFKSQCAKYSNIKRAWAERYAENYLYKMDGIVAELNRSAPITPDKLNNLWKQMDRPATFTPRYSEQLNLPNSLIHNYIGFSITYVTLEITSDSLHYTARKVKQLAIYLSQNNILKKVAICFVNAINQEVTQTLEDTVNNTTIKSRTT